MNTDSTNKKDQIMTCPLDQIPELVNGMTAAEILDIAQSLPIKNENRRGVLFCQWILKGEEEAREKEKAFLEAWKDGIRLTSPDAFSFRQKARSEAGLAPSDRYDLATDKTELEFRSEEKVLAVMDSLSNGDQALLYSMICLFNRHWGAEIGRKYNICVGDMTARHLDPERFDCLQRLLATYGGW